MAAVSSKDKKRYPTHQETILKKENWKGCAPPWPLSQTKEMKVTNRHGKIYLKGGRTTMAAFPNQVGGLAEEGNRQ